MNRTKFTFMAGMLLAAAFVFSCGDESGEAPASNTDTTCGGLPLTPSTHFCYADESFEKCNGDIYNIFDKFCLGGVLYNMCDGIKWDPETEFCSPEGDKLYEKCGGEEYNPVDFYCDRTTNTASPYNSCNGIPYDDNDSFCDNGKIYEKCDGNIYNPSTHFCPDGVPKPLCNGREYDSGEFCTTTNEIYNKCEYKKTCDVSAIAPYETCSNIPSLDGSYDPSTHFCYSGEDGITLVKKCNGKEYDFERDFCYESQKAIERCGGKTLDTLTQFCLGNTIGEYKFCPEIGSNKIRYNPSTHFCDDSNVIFPLCNSVSYKTLTHFCFSGNNEIYEKCDGRDYNPLDVGCFERVLYPLCTTPNFIGGVCVYNTLLRCKQTGSGEKYILKPHPGMKCLESSDLSDPKYSIYFAPNKEYRGKIVGEIEDGVSGMKYKTVQIGEQVWMAENLKKPVTKFQINYLELKIERFDRTEYKVDIIKYIIDDDDAIIDSVIIYNEIVYGPNPPDGSFPNPPNGYKEVLRVISATPKYTITDPNFLAKDDDIDIIPREKAVVGSIYVTPDDLTRYTVNNVGRTNYTDYEQLYKWGGTGGACNGCLNDQTRQLSHAERKGSCPSGWRIPSSADWLELINYAGGTSMAGNRLKSQDDWPSGNGQDNYGFNAKPVTPAWFRGDVASTLSTLDGVGAIWWTSTTLSVLNESMAKFWYVISSDTEAKELAYEKNLFEFSVRCLQNIE